MAHSSAGTNTHTAQPPHSNNVNKEMNSGRCVAEER